MNPVVERFKLLETLDFYVLLWAACFGVVWSILAITNHCYNPIPPGHEAWWRVQKHLWGWKAWVFIVFDAIGNLTVAGVLVYFVWRNFFAWSDLYQ